MTNNKFLMLCTTLAIVSLQGCSMTPPAKKIAKKNQLTPINISVSNMYMNHIDIDTDFFHTSCKSIFKSFLSGYDIKYVDDELTPNESTLSTLPVEIPFDELVKYGFVDHDYKKGKLTAICRSIHHPQTSKSITGIGFFLEGWTGKTWEKVDSNRMYEQRAYNIINDVMVRTDRKLQEGATK